MKKLDGYLRGLIEAHLATQGVERRRLRCSPSSMTNHVQRHALRIVNPREIEVDGARWFGVKTARGFERLVASELTRKGFRGYCPLGKKAVTWSNGRREKPDQIKVFARFAPYIFVGCPPGATVQKTTVDKVDGILRDSNGYLEIPRKSIQLIKDIELSEEWDETIFRPEKSPMQPGDAIKILSGSLAMFPAILRALHANGRADVSVHIFGRKSDVQLDACQIGAI